MITEFKCHIPQAYIDDLKFRISQTRWTDEIKNSGWEYGANLSYIRELTDHWLNKCRAQSIFMPWLSQVYEQ